MTDASMAVVPPGPTPTLVHDMASILSLGGTGYLASILEGRTADSYRYMAEFIVAPLSGT